MLVLGIESTCDETAASVVKDGKQILSNIIFSQAKLHEKFGGVFPEVASRSHAEKILPVINEALLKANVTSQEIDLIAVAYGPGLIGSLLVGLNTAKTLSLAWNKPFIGINHIEAHLYASMMEVEKPQFPALGVVLSGGHTQILYIKNIGNYQVLGTTIDDAIGESFDKVASMLALPYPGGPQIEKLAKIGDREKHSFKAGKVKENPFDFSFSGLKTKVLYTVKGQQSQKNSPLIISEEEKKHIAASFQKAAFSDVIIKTLLAAKKYKTKAIYFGGGVCNNQTLRSMFDEANIGLELHWPSFGLSLDNAAMIAGLGYHKFFEKKESDSLHLECKTRIRLA